MSIGIDAQIFTSWIKDYNNEQCDKVGTDTSYLKQ